MGFPGALVNVQTESSEVAANALNAESETGRKGKTASHICFTAPTTSSLPNMWIEGQNTWIRPLRILQDCVLHERTGQGSKKG